MTDEVRFIEADAFLSQYGDLYTKLFIGWSRENTPFRNPTWEQALVPYETANFDDDVFDALGTAITATGDQEVIMTISDTSPPHASSAVFKWRHESVVSAHRDSIICIFDYATFGQSGKWATISYHDELTRIAGEPLFMNAFINALGGRAAVKRRFFEFQAVRWDAPKDVQKIILASVGWDI